MPEIQGRNRRDNIKLTVDNETLTVSEWVERTNIPASVIYQRLSLGWDPAHVLTVPVRITTDGDYVKQIFAARQRGLTHTQIAKQVNVSISTVQAILSGRNRSSVSGKKFSKVEGRKKNVYIQHSPELDNKIKEWIEAKISKREMSKRLGVSRTVVDKLCKDLETNDNLY